MTQEEIVRRGEIAALLLDNPEIAWFFTNVKDLTRESITNTLPEEKDKRELLYNEYRGLESLQHTFLAYKTAAEEIIKAAEEADIESD